SKIVTHMMNIVYRGGRAWDEESPVRAERAWFLFRGERSPNREGDSTLGNREGDESLALPLICQINSITVFETLTSDFIH
ncbi:MAG: hypothetical protein R6V00_00390, partial [Candidatus Aminicenantes bacterium]